ncbi:alpha/beta fold hydrolase [Fodinicola acaciae]|uniref:alpha/beta fold hydrolase n=1 Tax=Fodinicola acaciae TaxID=2681555 RepID=UPI001FEC8B4F|nr:alpha/beta hydrolase [Fodinicola acaciae]
MSIRNGAKLSHLGASIAGMGTTISGFDGRLVGDVRVAVGGAGPPVLLLHGFPQTHLAWRELAPLLAGERTVVCADLPGYGGSAATGDGSKRAMADVLVRAMDQLGHETFAVVGHDRGALVAFRLSLDHPERVTHLAVLDVIPQADMWSALHGVGTVFAAHLPFLAQPADFPERLIAADPDLFFGHFLDIWQQSELPPDVRAEYLRASGKSIAAICADYRAGAFVDPRHDEQDRGKRLAMPVLAGWQDPGDLPLPFDPAEIWRRWAVDLRTATYPCGHFIAEDQPKALHDDLASLLAA